MTPKFTSPEPLSRLSALLHTSRCMLACTLSFCLVVVSGVAEARGRGDGTGTVGQPGDGRRHELRSVLATSHEVGERSLERRRLNPEERSALHRDLRDAMRGAYPEQPGAAKKKSH